MKSESYLTRKLRQGADLDREAVEFLERLAREARPVEAGRNLVQQDEAAEDVHLIVSGMACRYKITREGKRAIVALFLPGDFCDLHVALLNRMDHSIATLVDCEVVRIPRTTVKEMLERHPDIRRACWWATLVDKAVLREWLVNVARRRTDQQLAHLFCELFVRLSAVGLTRDRRFRMPFTQAVLADLIGVTPVHVQRTMARLREEGWITLQDRVIAFPDFAATAEFAEFDPGYLHLDGLTPGPPLP